MKRDSGLFNSNKSRKEKQWADVEEKSHNYHIQRITLISTIQNY